MSRFIQAMRAEFGHEDARSNEDYRAPVRKVYYEVDGTRLRATVVGATDEEARQTFDELATAEGLDTAEVTEIVPTDAQIADLDDRLYSHVHRKASRRDHGALNAAFNGGE